ncbi:MAG: signal peptidase II [Candidatus Dormibacteraeota bacterium]|nr:signal peptidase II [Candidatus Dormibacteraeota bacterium]
MDRTQEVGLNGGRPTFAIVAVTVFVVDRLTKGAVQGNVAAGTELQLLPGIWIANAHNSGAAFSFAPSLTPIFLIASVAVAVGMTWYVARNRVGLWAGVCLGLVLGGTVGNGYDRLVHGTVLDFFDVHFWPIFNVADAAISVGVVLLLAGYGLRRRPS